MDNENSRLRSIAKLVVRVILVLMALMLLLVAWVTFSDARALRTSGVTVTATVIDAAYERDGRSGDYYVTYRFTTKDGRSVTWKENSVSDQTYQTARQVGRLQVAYLPSDPKTTQPVSELGKNSSIVAPLALSTMSLVLLGVALFANSKPKPSTGTPKAITKPQEKLDTQLAQIHQAEQISPNSQEKPSTSAAPQDTPVQGSEPQPPVQSAKPPEEPFNPVGH